MQEEPDDYITYSARRDQLRPLEECSHEPNFVGEASEWAVTRALQLLPTNFTEKEWELEIKKATLDEAIISLTEDGLIDQIWDEKLGEVTFKISEKGKNIIKDKIE